MEIKPSQVLRGLGLCKLATESAHLPANQNGMSLDDSLLQKEARFIPDPASSWYTDIQNYIETGSTPDHLDMMKKTVLILK